MVTDRVFVIVIVFNMYLTDLLNTGAQAHNPVCEEVGTFYDVMCSNVFAIIHFCMPFTFFELPTFCGIL